MRTPGSYNQTRRRVRISGCLRLFQVHSVRHSTIVVIIVIIVWLLCCIDVKIFDKFTEPNDRFRFLAFASLTGMRWSNKCARRKYSVSAQESCHLISLSKVGSAPCWSVFFKDICIDRYRYISVFVYKHMDSEQYRYWYTSDINVIVVYWRGIINPKVKDGLTLHTSQVNRLSVFLSHYVSPTSKTSRHWPTNCESKDTSASSIFSPLYPRSHSWIGR